MRRFRVVLVRVLLGLVTAGLIVWLIDYLRLRTAPESSRFGSVIVQKYYAVATKSKKTEFMFDEPRPVTCVNSVLPHYGDEPCWYLEKHPKQKVDVGSTTNDYLHLP